MRLRPLTLVWLGADMAHITPAIASRARLGLVVGDEAPSRVQAKIRWIIVRKHRANDPHQPTPTGGAAMPAPKRAA